MITFPYSTCINSFFGSIIPISLFIFKCFFVLVLYIYHPMKKNLVCVCVCVCVCEHECMYFICILNIG